MLDMYDSIIDILTQAFGVIISNYFLSMSLILTLIGFIIVSVTNSAGK